MQGLPHPCWQAASTVGKKPLHACKIFLRWRRRVTSRLKQAVPFLYWQHISTLVWILAVIFVTWKEKLIVIARSTLEKWRGKYAGIINNFCTLLVLHKHSMSSFSGWGQNMYTQQLHTRMIVTHVYIGKLILSGGSNNTDSKDFTISQIVK